MSIPPQPMRDDEDSTNLHVSHART